MKDKLILLGDYVDRGLKSKQVVEQVKLLNEEYGVVCLKGNHDQMFVNIFYNDDDDYIFLHNGGIHTIESYCGYNWFENHQGFDYDRYIEAKEFIQKHYSHHIDFLKRLPLYYEDDRHIYTHAGLNPAYDDWKSQQPAEDFLWIREEFINNPTNSNTDKVIVFGHTPTVNIHRSPNIWFDTVYERIGIDGGAIFGYQLNCLEISDDGWAYKEYAVKK